MSAIPVPGPVTSAVTITAKRRSWRAWNLLALSSLVAAAAAMPIANVVIDPFDLFHVGPLGPGPNTNQRFAQLRRLTEKPGEFDILMLGTSIMGINPPSTIERLLPGTRAYNMGFFLATSSDLLEASRYLSDRGALPARVIVGVDPFLFVARDAHLRKEFEFPPEVTGQSPAKWWSDAVFSSSGAQIANKIFDKLQPLPAVRFEAAGGNYSLPSAAAARLRDPAAHAAKAFKPIPPIRDDAHLVQADFDALEQLSDFFKARNVAVLWLIEPTSRPLRNAYGPDAYDKLLNRMKRGLGDDVVDLSDLPGLADDPQSWYDAKHFTEMAGERVLTVAIQQARNPSFHVAKVMP